MTAVTVDSGFRAQENKICHCFPIYLPQVMEPDTMILVFWMLSFNKLFHSHIHQEAL